MINKTITKIPNDEGFVKVTEQRGFDVMKNRATRNILKQIAMNAVTTCLVPDPKLANR